MAAIFVDHVSQPSRALLIFCRVNKLPVEEKLVNVAKRQHLSPEYKAMYALGKIPIFKDGDFVLPESAAILRYLAAMYKVPDHWYPADLKARAKVDAAMDWHHGNTRAGAAGLTFQKVIAPQRGIPVQPAVMKEAETTLRRSLQALENYWLANTRFLAGNDISIADLLIATELEQLTFIDVDPAGPTMAELLEPVPKVRAWLARVAETTRPVYADVHVMLHKATARLLAASKKAKL